MLHEEDWQENDLVSWQMRHYNNGKYQMATKFDVSSGTYLCHQPCGVWNVEY